LYAGSSITPQLQSSDPSTNLAHPTAASRQETRKLPIMKSGCI
jgi:hypothetical protein